MHESSQYDIRGSIEHARTDVESAHDSCKFPSGSTGKTDFSLFLYVYVVPHRKGFNTHTDFTCTYGFCCARTTIIYRQTSSGFHFPFVFCRYELRRPLPSFGRATNTKYQKPHAGGNPLPMIFFSSSRGLASHEANHISFCTKISSSTLAFRTRRQRLILVLLCSSALVSRPNARRALSTLHTKS